MSKGVFPFKTCNLFSFFYTSVTCSGGGMVDVRKCESPRSGTTHWSHASECEHPRSGATHERGTRTRLQVSLNMLGWWNGRHVRFRCVCPSGVWVQVPSRAPEQIIIKNLKIEKESFFNLVTKIVCYQNELTNLRHFQLYQYGFLRSLFQYHQYGDCIIQPNCYLHEQLQMLRYQIFHFPEEREISENTKVSSIFETMLLFLCSHHKGRSWKGVSLSLDTISKKNEGYHMAPEIALQLFMKKMACQEII